LTKKKQAKNTPCTTPKKMNSAKISICVGNVTGILFGVLVVAKFTKMLINKKGEIN
jgi:hypothetical protein